MPRPASHCKSRQTALPGLTSWCRSVSSMKLNGFSMPSAWAIGWARMLFRSTARRRSRSLTWAARRMRRPCKPFSTASAKQSMLMALADEIRSLRDRALADLNAAHDYYTDTKIAWDIIGRVITAGHTFSIRSLTTGAVTTQADLAGKAQGYVAEQLAEATFQQFI